MSSTTPPATSGIASDGPRATEPGDATATLLALGDVEGAGEGGAGEGLATATVGLGLLPPAAVPGGQAMTLAAAMSPAPSTVVEKQYVERAMSIVASTGAGIRSSYRDP